MNSYFNLRSYKKPTGGRFFVRIRQKLLLALIPLIPTMIAAQDATFSSVDLKTAIANNKHAP